jgi:hypothetical protein
MIMVKGNTASEADDAVPAAPSPAQRKLSSARADEDAPQGEFWALLRSVAVLVGVVVLVGWIIG